MTIWWNLPHACEGDRFPRISDTCGMFVGRRYTLRDPWATDVGRADFLEALRPLHGLHR
jgi:hypothetical protein